MPSVTCECCGKMFGKRPCEIRKSTHNFCSRSCSAKVMNRLRSKKLPNKCFDCGKLLESRKSARCYRCSRTYIFTQKVTEVLKTGVIPTPEGYRNSAWGRKMLIHLRGYRCEICGIETWRNEPVPLTLDHINGNAFDHRLENVRMICRNCDGLLPTFKGRNHGNGRILRKREGRDKQDK